MSWSTKARRRPKRRSERADGHRREHPLLASLHRPRDWALPWGSWGSWARGNFGGRLVDLLLDEERSTLIVAGRDLDAAHRFCDARSERAASLIATKFDRAEPEHGLAELKPDVVVDAAGPFQLYGSDPYKLAKAAVAHGANYIDLADGREFVKGIGALDADAKIAQKWVLSGARSLPHRRGKAPTHSKVSEWPLLARNGRWRGAKTAPRPICSPNGGALLVLRPQPPTQLSVVPSVHRPLARWWPQDRRTWSCLPLRHFRPLLIATLCW